MDHAYKYHFSARRLTCWKGDKYHTSEDTHDKAAVLFSLKINMTLTKLLALITLNGRSYTDLQFDQLLCR